MADSGVTTRGPSVLVVTVIFLVLSTIFVTLRMVARIGIVKRLNADDYVMVFAWLIAFGLSFSICYGTSVGLGRHQTDVPMVWASALKKSEYVFSVLYNPALMATKTSILLFYLRLSVHERIFRWSCYGTLAVINVAGLALTILNIVQCRPLTAAFQTPIPENATCENIVTLYLSSAPVNIITDLAVLFLPMPILTSMRLPRKQKIILIITFGVGFFVTVVDVIRIAYLQSAATARFQALQDGSLDASGVGQRNDTDLSWYGSLSYMWSAVEVNVGIMCGCVPGLKPLVSRFIPNLLRDMNVKSLSTSKTRTETEKVDSMDVAQPKPLASLNEAIQPKKYGIEIAEGSCSSTSHNDENGISVDLIDFLTTPDMKELPQLTQTNVTKTTTMTHEDTSPAFFDFVNMRGQKSMVDMTTRESLFPNIMVTVLFLIWGIAYGFLDTLNSQFQTAAGMSAWQATGIHSAYFGGYFVAPLTFGRRCLIHWGFKACYIIGLVIYACGVLIFWPSAVLTSFPAFLVSNFIVGMGLSTLEIAANPFVALCGPQRYMEMRLNLSQAVQAIGSVVSPLLAQKVLFKSATSASSLVDVQWAYLGIALFVILLAVGYYYVPLPEATDAELERAQAQRTDYANIASISGVRIIWISLGLGVLSQWVYVGAQESISTSLVAYGAQAFGPTTISASSWTAIGHTCFAVGRFTAAGLNYFIKARYLLLFFYAGAIALSAVAMTYSGVTAQAVIMVLYFFEGPIFSLIYAISLRGMGKHTKNASALLTAAISGGACWPPIMYAVAISTGKGDHYAYCVVIAAFAIGAMLPIWQNFQPMAKKLADPLPQDTRHLSLDRTSIVGSSPQQRSMSFFKGRRRKESTSGVEHVEQAEFTTP